MLAGVRSFGYWQISRLSFRVRRVQFDRCCGGPSYPQIEHFDKYGKGHRGVNVTLRNMLVETFSHERHADQQEKTQRQHLYGRMVLDEAADRSGKTHHDEYRDDHRGRHDSYVVDHADGGNNRVERKNYVEKQNLHDHAGKCRRHARRRTPLLAFESLVNLVSAFGDQKQPADDED